MSHSDNKNENGNPNEGFKTHSPELYSRGTSNEIRVMNLKVLDLLQMSFESVPSEDQQFLDIGCGVGDFTRDDLLSHCLPCKRLVATDASGDMLNYARQNFGHPKITYDVLDIGGDVSSFVTKYGVFSRIYSFFCLNWVKDKEVAMTNISRLLAPGGECLLVFAIGARMYDFWKEIGEMERWKAYKSVLDKFSPEIPGAGTKTEVLDYFSKLFKQSNLAATTCEIIYKPPAALDLETTIKAQLSTNPVIPLLSEQDKKDFVHDYSEIIRRRWDDKGAPTSTSTRFLLIHASKHKV